MRTCPDCKTLVDDQAVFCDNCGHNFLAPDAPPDPVESGRDVRRPPENSVNVFSASGASQFSAFTPEKPALAGVPPSACFVCGYVNDPADTYCQNCGVLLTESPQPPESSSYPIAAGLVPPVRLEEAGQGALSQPEPRAGQEPQFQVSEVAQSTCSTCGYFNTPGEMFCQNCGVQLAPLAVVPPPPPFPLPSQASQSQSGAAAPGIPPGKAVAIPGLCRVCGFHNELGDVYCQNCGERLLPLQASPPTPAPLDVAAQGELEPVDERRSPEPDLAKIIEFEIGQELRCFVCGYINNPPSFPGEGLLFCENCGVELRIKIKEAASVDVPKEDSFKFVKFVLRETGVEILFPPGKTEILIGRTDPDNNIFPEVDLAAYEGLRMGVSRQHARLVIEGGHVYIEDLKSTNYTFLNKKRLEPGTRYPLNPGDEVSLGSLVLDYLRR